MKKFNILVNKKCTNIARASKNFKPAARRVKKTDETEVLKDQLEVDQVEVEVNVENDVVEEYQEL